jgi:hypothetical protein
MADFAELREEIGIEEVIVYLGGRILSGGWGGGWRSTVCPFCADSNGSGSLNRPLGRFLCHQCGAPRDGRSGDVVDIAKYELGTTSTEEAVKWLKRTFQT